MLGLKYENRAAPHNLRHFIQSHCLLIYSLQNSSNNLLDTCISYQHTCGTHMKIIYMNVPMHAVLRQLNSVDGKITILFRAYQGTCTYS